MMDFLRDLLSSPAAAILAGLVALAAAYRHEIVMGRRRVLDGCVGTMIDAMAVAISQVRYRCGANYTALSKVRDALYENGLTFQNQGTINRDGDSIDKALAAAAALPVEAAIVSHPTFTQNDNGYVDLAKLGFRLFGFRVSAIVDSVFLLLAVSSVLFTIAFRDHPACLWLLAASLAGFYLMLAFSAVLDGSEIKSLNDQRALSALCLIPALHATFAAAVSLPPSWIQAGLLLAQAVIFHLGVSARMAGKWMTLPALLTFLLELARSVFPPDGLSLDGLANAGLWAYPILALAPWALEKWRRWRMHPIYFSDYAAPTYVPWHAMYMGFAVDKATWDANRQESQTGEVFDDNGFDAARRWQAAHPDETLGMMEPPGSQFCSSSIGIRFRTYERIMRRVCLDYLSKNRGSMPRLYLWLKPMAFLAGLRAILRPLGPVPLLRAFGAFVLAATICLGIGATIGSGGGPSLAFALAALAVTCPAPVIWAYTVPHALLDQAWVAMVVGLALGGGVIALLM